MWFLLLEGQAASSDQNCCKVKTLWISINSYDMDKQNRLARVPSIVWYLLQIKATAMRSSLNWHFIPDQFWKTEKENKVMLHANLERFYIHNYMGRASRTTIPWNKLLFIAFATWLWTKHTKHRSASPGGHNHKGYAADTSKLWTVHHLAVSLTSLAWDPAGVAWSLAGLAILRSSDRLIFNMLVWCSTLNSDFWKYLNLPTLQNAVVLGQK